MINELDVHMKALMLTVKSRSTIPSKRLKEDLQKVTSYYNIKVPILFLSDDVLLQFSDGDVIDGHVWMTYHGTGDVIAILLSERLMKMGIVQLLYVLIHEIGHIKHHNLKASFIEKYDELATCVRKIEDFINEWRDEELPKVLVKCFSAKRRKEEKRIMIAHLKKEIKQT